MHHRDTEEDEAAQRKRKCCFFANAKKQKLRRFAAALCINFLFFGSACADWAEERLAAMSFEEKVGQLFIMPACQLRGEDHREDLRRAVEKYKIGGVILKQGTVAGQLELIEWLQNLADIPLLCVGDAEWGLAMRLSDLPGYPKNGVLGTLQDRSRLYEIGQEIGKECKRAGLHVNLAPVVDVNSNPKNPIIGIRSFGGDPALVAECAVFWLRGHQNGGTAACAKHFPGHGDTSVDSHVDLPVVKHDLQRLKTVELLPFQRAIDAGVELVMTAHLLVPALDDKPATFSHTIVTKLLKETMGFQGLIITDALNMKALANHYTIEEIARQAFTAGHDLLLYGDHIAPNIDDILRIQLPRAVAALKGVPEQMLDQRVLKILRLKEKYVEELAVKSD